jgi:3-oxoacyl-[acyl-carrier-protein] synthase II
VPKVDDQRVAITGSAALMAGVVGAPALWAWLQHDQLLRDRAMDPSLLRGLAGLSPGEARVLSRQQHLGLAAVELAWVQAGLAARRQPLRGEGHPGLEEPWRLRAGVVSASALGHVAALLEEQASTPQRPSATSLSRWRGNGLGAAVALRFGLQGEQLNLNAASSTGAQALALAGRLIRSGDQDLMVVVGAEPQLQPLLRQASQKSGALAASGSSQPLTASRSGMVPREAAGCLVLERRESAEARGAVPLAWLEASVTGCEAHHLVAPLPGQALSQRLLQRLLPPGARDRQAIDWICLHATGTRRFDAEEIAFLRQSFPAIPWITAMKRSLGHGLGAAGVVEAALILEGLSRRAVPPWPRDLDPALVAAPPPGTEAAPLQAPATAPEPRLALQLASGMGGVVVMNLLAAAQRCRHG